MQKILKDNLVLRSLSEGIESDRANLTSFYTGVFGEEGDEDAVLIGNWVDELLAGQHPTVTFEDIWVVVDPANDDKIASALLLIPQTWRYEHIEVPVGRVEIVATDKDYRQRGLVRELMTVAHDRSQSLGHIMQGITGIGHYYRRFGYTMAIDLGGRILMPYAQIPELKAEQTPKFTLRRATGDDILNIEKWEAYERRNGGLSVVRDWDYEINQRPKDTPISMQIFIVESADGDDVGFVSMHMDRFYRDIHIWYFIIGDQSNYFDTFDDVLRGIKAHADEFYANLPDDKSPIELRFDGGVSPAIQTIARKLNNATVRDLMYAWYIRVDDVPVFIKHIAPVLEKRLQGSGMNRFTGEFKIGFYKLNGIKITFEDGGITDVVATEMAQYDADTAFAYDTFLNLLFGHRTRREIAHILPETYANRKADLLLDALFPKMRTFIGNGIG